MQTATVSAWTPCSSRSLSPCASPAASLRGSWSYDILFLPSHLERHIKILKSSLPLGVTLDADVDKAINGCVVKNICSKKALAKDGRIQTGDFIVKINGENLRNVTNAQARAIMKRANLIGAHCNISYITSSDARLWKDRFHRLDSVTMFPTNDNIQQIRSEQNVFESSRLSPKVYPKFYKSPLFNEDLLLLATTTNALNFSIGSSELQSPNNVDEHFLPSTSEILENKEESRKEEISQLNQINFEKFVDNLQKAIITDAIFDLYILWRRDKQSILHSNIAPSLSSQFSTSPKTLRSPRAVRASSIALTQPPPKPEKGILRRAASSFKKVNGVFMLI
uniref:PDZ domain-containing protein n=1 Tax=Meloidogyne hapla TaxID=6305 RepID=A0A1I8AXU5_MELHA